MTSRFTGHRMRTFLRSAAVTAAMAVAAAAPAAAQDDDGVFVDPSSPSGKEYQIPLESVRRQADPTTRPGAKVAPGERSSPLFGEGIDPGTASGAITPGGNGGGGAGGGSSSGSAPPDAPAAPKGSAPSRAIEAARSAPGAPPGDTGSLLVILSGAALVLLAGCGAGIALRRGGPRSA